MGLKHTGKTSASVWKIARNRKNINIEYDHLVLTSRQSFQAGAPLSKFKFQTSKVAGNGQV